MLLNRYPLWWTAIMDAIATCLAMALGLLLISVSWPNAAQAAGIPKANSSQECGVYADIALLAAAGAKQGVAIETMRAIAADMYTAKTPNARELVSRVISAAYAQGPKIVPRDFSNRLGMTCLSRSGDMSELLGVDS